MGNSILYIQTKGIDLLSMSILIYFFYILYLHIIIYLLLEL